jgi:hypothetical protein
MASAEPSLPPDATEPRDAAATARLVKSVLSVPDNKIDFARAELTFEKLVAPQIDVGALLGQIEEITRTVKSMAGPSPTNRTKLIALKAYIYQSGPWNDFKPYRYDFSDPRGEDFSHALISRYMATRLGNCVSMPFLFIILADKLGLPVAASMAPRHIFVKYFDDVTGKTINLESTSGANPARDVWIRQSIPMSDRAVKSGIYLRALTKKETIAAMAAIILESDHARFRYSETIAVADLLLKYYPNFAQAMVFRAMAYGALRNVEFLAKYKMLEAIPMDQRRRYTVLTNESSSGFAKARALGWRATDGAKPALPPSGP